MPIRRWTPILYDIAQALESLQDPQARVNRALTLLKGVVPYERCAMLELAPLISHTITVVPPSSTPEEDMTLTRRLETLLELLIGEELTEAPTWAVKASQDSLVHLAVPIFSLGKVIGILFVERSGAPFNENHLAFLSIVAAQLGAYLTALKAESETSALLEQRERDVEFLEMFVAMLGHDLRNPITAIVNLAHVLKYEGGERLAGSLDRILASADRMVDMIDQLLDLTRIRLASGIPIEPRHVTLSELCRRAIDEIQASAAPGASIQLQVRGDTAGFWDPGRLLQVVSNLVSNAVKHSHGAGPVRVSVAGGSETVGLRVHNPGAIASELLPEVFEPFHATSASQRSGGLGLGLFIVKHIVEAHDGEIFVESSEEEGTTFVVRLPRELPEWTAQSSEARM